jgi:hypothetical protein
VKMGPKTERHDFEFKVKHVRRFLEEGHKAKVTVRLRAARWPTPSWAGRCSRRWWSPCRHRGGREQPPHGRPHAPHHAQPQSQPALTWGPRDGPKPPTFAAPRGAVARLCHPVYVAAGRAVCRTLPWER